MWNTYSVKPVLGGRHFKQTPSIIKADSSISSIFPLKFTTIGLLYNGLPGNRVYYPLWRDDNCWETEIGAILETGRKLMSPV